MTIEHPWGAPKTVLDRDVSLENYAYAFIHTNKIKNIVKTLFGDDMQFDVIIGNPPYQMKGGAGGTSDSSIYHLFVEQAKRLEPKYLSMVIHQQSKLSSNLLFTPNLNNLMKKFTIIKKRYGDYYAHY